MARFLLIGGGPKGLDAKLMVEWGFDVVCFDLPENIQKHHDNLSKATALYEVKNPKDYSAIVELAKKAHSRHPFTNAVSFTEWGLFPVAHIVDAFGFEGNGVEAVENTVNKLKMRERLTKKGFSKIKYAKISKLADFIKFCQDTHFKCVLKDVFGGGKINLFIVKSEADYHDFKNKIVTTINDNDFMIAEEFVGGMEISVETFGWAGKIKFITYTKKHKIPPFNVEIGHTIPANLSEDLKAKIKNFVSDCLLSIGIKYGVCHTEIFIKDKTLHFIETHTRPGGGNIYDLLLYAHNIDIIKAACYYTSGNPIPFKIGTGRSAASRFFCPPEGYYKRIKGIALLERSRIVKEHSLKLPENGYLPEVVNNRLRHCGVITSDECDADQLDHRTDELISKVQFIPV